MRAIFLHIKEEIYMKKILFCCLLASLVLVGCGKKDKLPANQEESVQKQDEVIVEQPPAEDGNEKLDALESENKESQEKITELESTIEEKDAEIKSLEDELQKLADELTAKANKNTGSTSKYHFVVCGSFSTMTNANKQIATLQDAGFQSYAKQSGKYVRVIAGTFKNKENAKKQEQSLEKAGYDAFVISSR